GLRGADTRLGVVDFGAGDDGFADVCRNGPAGCLTRPEHPNRRWVGEYADYSDVDLLGRLLFCGSFSGLHAAGDQSIAAVRDYRQRARRDELRGWTHADHWPGRADAAVGRAFICYRAPIISLGIVRLRSADFQSAVSQCFQPAWLATFQARPHNREPA